MGNPSSSFMTFNHEMPSPSRTLEHCLSWSFADSLGGHGCYTGLDLFVAFDHRSLLVLSHDLTTFQSPLFLLQLTSLPIGATNSVQILQGDISFILQDEMPNMAVAFMDDVNIKGHLPTRRPLRTDGILQLPLRNPHHNHIWSHVHRVRMVSFMRLLQKILEYDTLSVTMLITLIGFSSGSKRLE